MIKNMNQFRALTENVLKAMEISTGYNFHSNNAVVVTCMIAAHESGQFKHRVQIDGDSDKYDGALGLNGIEWTTFDDTMLHCDKASEVMRAMGLSWAKFSDLEHSDVLSIVITRLRLSMDTNPLPDASDLMRVAEYCKSYWNTDLGKATAQKYYDDYMISVGGL